MKISYVTGNKMKFEIAENVFKNSKISLMQKKIDTPEIQSFEVKDIAEYSAIWASRKLKSDVIVTDAGFYINGLNGFPGPYIKYINQWLDVDDILNLLENKKDRSICIKDCLVYCSENGQVHVFENEMKGKIARTVTCENGSIIDRLVIPDSLDCTIAQLSYDEAIDFWGKNSNFTKLKEWIEKNE